MADERWRFERIGLGYKVYADPIYTEIRLTHVKRRSDGIHGDLRVTTGLAGIKTNDGVMHMARFNASSSSARSSLAKLLESRTPGQIDKMDWFDGLEVLCQKVMVTESIGQPFLDIGNQVVTRNDKYLIDPLVPLNVSALLYGPGGSGKSILALACALSVRNGREIIPGLAPTTKGNVLYLDWETDAPIINERTQAIAAGAGFTSSPIIYRRCIKPLADEAEDIATVVADREIVFMVIDSAGMAMGAGGEYGDANESTLRLFDAIRFINVSTQIVDHVSKQEMRSKGKVSGLMPYGSIYKVNLARTSWEVRNGTSPDDETVRLALVHTKVNDSRLHPQIGLELEWTPGNIVFRQSDMLPTYTVEPSGPDAPASIKELLSDGVMMKPPAMAKLLAEMNISESAMRSALWRMTQNGELVKMADGSYRLANKGFEADEAPGGDKPWHGLN